MTHDVECPVCDRVRCVCDYRIWRFTVALLVWALAVIALSALWAVEGKS